MVGRAWICIRGGLYYHQVLLCPLRSSLSSYAKLTPHRPPAVQQIAFADKVLLNKVDLVSEEEKKAVVSRIRVGVDLSVDQGL